MCANMGIGETAAKRRVCLYPTYFQSVRHVETNCSQTGTGNGRIKALEEASQYQGKKARLDNEILRIETMLNLAKITEKCNK